MDSEISTPTDLYELLGDSHSGYLEASNSIRSHTLSKFLSELSAQRQLMQHELGAELHQLMPDLQLAKNTWKGNLHRAWMDFRQAWARAEDDVILRECQRGETYLLDRFSTALKSQELPDDLYAVLRAQKSSVKATLTTVKQLHATAIPIAKVETRLN